MYVEQANTVCVCVCVCVCLLVAQLQASLVAQTVICLQCRRPGFHPLIRKIPWRREWLPTPVFLPGESHGQRSLMGCSSPKSWTGLSN